MCCGYFRYGREGFLSFRTETVMCLSAQILHLVDWIRSGLVASQFYLFSYCCDAVSGHVFVYHIILCIC